MAQSEFRDIRFTDEDVVNPDEFSSIGGNYGYHAWLLHDHGFCVCVVIAQNEQDALDEATDRGKLRSYLVTPEEEKDYNMETCEGLTFLGNASEAHDIEGLGLERLPDPEFSFCALFNEATQ